MNEICLYHYLFHEELEIIQSGEVVPFGSELHDMRKVHAGKDSNSGRIACEPQCNFESGVAGWRAA